MVVANASLSPEPHAEATVGDVICQLLTHWDVRDAFGVISIHNMPILDPLGRRNDIRFVPARGEAGAVNMADAYARVSGKLGVAFTSTGTAAGNAAGAMVEALTAGSPVLHITGQIETEHLGRNRAYIHEAPSQLDMLKAVSKGAFQIMRAADTIDVMTRAAELALSSPRGPVSVEIPVDIQAAPLTLPKAWPELRPSVIEPAASDLDSLADLLRQARRPVLLLGGGARGAEDEALQLAQRGVCIVTSTSGRAIVPEDHPASLGAFNCTPEIQALYRTCDLMIAIGTRLRGNETWTYKLELPAPLAVVDVSADVEDRAYPADLFVQADAKAVLRGLLDRIGADWAADPSLMGDIAATRDRMHHNLRLGLGPYAALVDEIQKAMPAGSAWVRDVTLSNSIWGNRYLRIDNPRAGVHAVGGGIGQGLPMGIGAAIASPAGAIVLTGDGGLNLCLGEIATAAETTADLTMIIMNDAGYGVIRNIQDADYGGRKRYSNILVPDYAKVSESVGIPFERVRSIGEFAPALARALALKGPSIVEIDMVAIGPIPMPFAGPPRKTADTP